MKMFTNRMIIKFSVSFFAAFFSIYLIVKLIKKFIKRRQCLQTKTPTIITATAFLLFLQTEK